MNTTPAPAPRQPFNAQEVRNRTAAAEVAKIRTTLQFMEDTMRMVPNAVSMVQAHAEAAGWHIEMEVDLPAAKAVTRHLQAVTAWLDSATSQEPSAFLYAKAMRESITAFEAEAATATTERWGC